METDPIKQVEKIVKNLHDGAGKYTKPVLSRYPLLFGFLVIFSVAAILHGFELWADQIELFEKYPGVLILIGVLMLVFTGSLYKELERR